MVKQLEVPVKFWAKASICRIEHLDIYVIIIITNAYQSVYMPQWQIIVSKTYLYFVK